MQARVIIVSNTLKSDSIHEVDKIRAAIKAIDEWQLTLMAPKNFDNESPDYYIKKLEKGFETLCASLEEVGVMNPKRLTVFEFYSRLEHFKNKKPKGGNQNIMKP